MTRKRLVIELDEKESADSYAINMAVEKVQSLMSQGFTSGNSPLWYLEDKEESDE